jgi:hypothetical protein
MKLIILVLSVVTALTAKIENDDLAQNSTGKKWLEHQKKTNRLTYVGAHPGVTGRIRQYILDMRTKRQRTKELEHHKHKTV